METKSRRIKIFETGIERLSRIMSAKWKIKVVFKANECHTDEKLITLPVVPNNASEEFLKVLQGFCDHECAHQIDTDFKALTKISKKDRKIFLITNSIEDARVERLQCLRFRGSVVNLNHSREWSLKKIAEKQEIEDPDNVGQKIQSSSWDQLSDFGKVTLAASTYAQVNFDKDHWFFKEVVESETMEKVFLCEDILRKARIANDTGEVIELAREMLALLKEAEEPVEEIDIEDIREDDIILPPGSPMSGSNPMHKKGKVDPNAPRIIQMQEADGDEENNNKSSKKIKIPTGMKQPKFKESEEKQKASGITDVSDSELDKDAKLTDKSEQIKDAAKFTFNNKDNYLVYTTEGDKFEKIKDGDRVEYKRFLNDAVKYVSVIKNKLSRSLLSTNVSKWEGDKLRGKLNPRALFRVPIGTSKRVFRQRVEAEEFNTAVEIMIDHSGSMNGGKIELASKTAIVLGEVLHMLRIPFSVTGFSTEQSSIAYDRKNKAKPEEQNIYSRWGNLWIGLYKDYDESWPNVNHKLINMRRNEKVNTYDGESLRFGTQRLLGRPETRKILFWLNDGHPQPNDCDNYQSHTQYAKDCGSSVDSMIELVAVGIKTNSVNNFYKNCIVVNDIEELPGVCISQLATMLNKNK